MKGLDLQIVHRAESPAVEGERQGDARVIRLCTHTHSHTYSHAHIHIHTHSHTLSLSHTHTHAHTPSNRRRHSQPPQSLALDFCSTRVTRTIGRHSESDLPDILGDWACVDESPLGDWACVEEALRWRWCRFLSGFRVLSCLRCGDTPTQGISEAFLGRSGSPRRTLAREHALTRLALIPTHMLQRRTSIALL